MSVTDLSWIIIDGAWAEIFWPHIETRW